MSSYVCRVCLTGNIRMQKIHDNHFQEMYEKLTNAKVTRETVTALIPEMHNLRMTKAKTLVSVNIPLSNTECTELVNVEEQLNKRKNWWYFKKTELTPEN